MKLNDKLFAPLDDEGASGGGTVDWTPPDTFESDDQNVNDEQSDDSSDDDDSQTPNPTAAWDPAAFSAAIVNGLKPVLERQSATKPPVAISDEEFQRATGYTQVSVEDIKELFGDDDNEISTKKAKQLQKLLDGQATHAMKVARLVMDAELKKVRDEYTPVIKAQREAVYDNYVTDVERSHPTLKGMKPVIKMAMDHLANSGFQSDGNPANDRKAIYSVVEQIARQVNPQFSLAKVPNTSGTVRTSIPKMGAGVNSGGGAGGNPAKKQKLQPWQQVFAK